MTEPIIQLNHVSHSYEEDVPAIYDITLAIPDNAFLAIIGHNGAGKTTLVKHLNGLLKPTSGQVTVAGLDTQSVTTAALARHVGFVFQNPDHQIFSSTVQEEITFGLINLGISEPERGAQVERVMEMLGLLPYRDTPPAMLGYGLRRQVTLAAVLAMNPRILVLDEPTVGLDAHSTEEFLAFVQQMHRQGHTILLVTHDMRLVARYCSLCLVMSQGRVAGYAPTRAIFSQPALLAAAGIAQPAITRLACTLHDIGMPADILSVHEFAEHYLQLGEAQP